MRNLRLPSFRLSRRRWLLVIVCILLPILAAACINAYVVRSTSGLIHMVAADVPEKQVILVLGARVYASGAASPILEDRLLTAAELYHGGKAQKLIVSGDHGRKDYDEVRAMRDFLVAEGIPAQDIFMDHAGFDTYDSMYRARDVFQAEGLIVVTQRFHLPRALYIARKLGIDAVGIPADRREYAPAAARRNAMREPLARLKAFGSVLFGAKPTYLGDPIPVTGDGRETDDTLDATPL